MGLKLPEEYSRSKYFVKLYKKYEAKVSQKILFSLSKKITLNKEQTFIL